MRRILHIAPFNTAGVPIAFVKAERALGMESRLITFGRNSFGFEEDICLDLPFIDGHLFQKIRNRLTIAGRRAEQSMLQSNPETPRSCPPIWSPGFLEKVLMSFRDRLWHNRIQQVIKDLDFFSFDVYQFDGGLDFTRHGDYVKQLHALGKKIVCCYLGSDLRLRGIIPDVDAHSHLNFTVEFDHLDLHPYIHYVFFPFDPWPYEPRKEENNRLRLFHSATNRAYKGSDHIIAVGQALEKALGVEFVFMENTPHNELMAMKQQSDIVIDQITNIGGIGYGISSLEALSMGIPVCTRLTPEYEAFISDHPFVSVTPETLYDRLADLIQDTDKRRWYGQQGRHWVEQYHDARNVVSKMHAKYGEQGWFED